MLKQLGNTAGLYTADGNTADLYLDNQILRLLCYVTDGRVLLERRARL
jgi:hypothetical protein